MKLYFTILITCLFISSNCVSQDTITVMQYNLLYYGLYDNDVNCTENNNNISDKTDYLKTIIDYCNPDIFGVNEISSEETYQEYLLNNVFLLNGYENYDRATTRGSYLTSQIYYNTNKLTLQKESWVNCWPRFVYIYKFYYNSPELQTGDTVFFHCFVAHLKAGSDNEDVDTRTESIENVMQHVEEIGEGNYLFMGDLNLYTNTEPAYQYLTNPTNTSLSFNDPVNAEGEWHNNSLYSDYHTQSTLYNGNVCGATGGLDDRFDFILLSNNIMNGSNKVEYINNSYTTVAQDGNHFNDGLTYNGNSSVPYETLMALASNSDHLPITLDLKIEQTPINIDATSPYFVDIKINNPVIENLSLQICLNSIIKEQDIKIEIYSIIGNLVYKNMLTTNDNKTNYSIPLSHLNNGLYILKIHSENSIYYSNKFVKINN